MAEAWKRDIKRSIFKNTLYQQLGIVNTWNCYSVSKASKNLIQRLKRQRVLDDHTGCVNTVVWSDSGSLLLSGSDDYSLNLYDSYSTRLIHSIKSGHTANVFSAKFLPCTSDTKIVSCAGDGMLQYNIVGTEYGQNYFNCHSGTTYEVLVTPGDPNSFLSCGEDGTVRLFDLRTKTKCHCQECADDILVDAKHAVTSVSINPMLPYHLAVGCKDSYVRVFDRRTLGTSPDTRSVNRNRGWMPGLFCKFKPSTFKQDSNCRVTSLQYSNDGNDLLVSYCSDYVYLFTVRDESSKMEGFSNEDGSTDPSASDALADNLPPAKRLRLRGDWSDTGPNARPDTDEDEDSLEPNIMQRMSEFFSRWIEGAVSSTMRHASTSSEDEDADHAQLGGSQSTPGGSQPTPGGSQLSTRHRISLLDQNDEPTSSSRANETDLVNEELNHGTDGGDLDMRSSSSLHHTLNNDDIQHQTATQPYDANDNADVDQPDERTPLLVNNSANNLPSSNLTSLAGTSSSGMQNPIERESPDTDAQDSDISSSDGSSSSSSSSTSDTSHPHLPATTTTTSLMDDGDESDDADGSSSSHSHLPTTTTTTSLVNDDDDDDDEFDLSDAFRERLQNAYASATRYTMERQHAASKIQSFIRIHRERQREMEMANARRPNHMYTPKEKMVYRGHRNARTMIKEANFWGDDFVLSGSDCGRVFIWDRHTAELVMLLEGDRHVVNCVQPHPFDPVLATSGIDHDIKLWAPLADAPATLMHADEIMRRNERMLEETRDTITVPAAFVLRMFASLGSIRRNRRRMLEDEHEESSE